MADRIETDCPYCECSYTICACRDCDHCHKEAYDPYMKECLACGSIPCGIYPDCNVVGPHPTCVNCHQPFCPDHGRTIVINPDGEKEHVCEDCENGAYRDHEPYV